VPVDLTSQKLDDPPPAHRSGRPIDMSSLDVSMPTLPAWLRMNRRNAAWVRFCTIASP
jgi:hypothetical protein